MKLKFFNTRSGKKEEFTPRLGNEVSLYTCGPTVYNYAHIGNLRTFIFYDVLRRVLEMNSFKVNHVMNITDVGHLTDDADQGEDKMENGAAREGKTVWEIAQFYTEAFMNDARALNLRTPTTMPMATKHIPEQIDLIKRLEKKDLTYEISDGIYFDTSKFRDYGKMAKLDIAGLQEGARVKKNNEKWNVTDFALWKFSPKNSRRAMEWDSPWGIGFPGWHIECSAMAMKYLGETLDIHAGGIDHKQVHHTNEIAQSEGATGKPFARFWMHGEFLQIDSSKMSKSSENFVTLHTLKEKKIDPLAYRYFVLSAHYRSKLNFTREAMESAQKGYSKLISLVAQWDEPKIGCAEIETRFMQAINDDLNTPQVLAILWELVKSTEEPSSAKASSIFKMDEVLGLSLRERAEYLKDRIAEAHADVNALIQERERARKNKEYEKADAIREQIEAAGLTIEDTNEGPVLGVK